ncbi:MAG: hypothetical protein C4583_05780 [Anaerolineaceae bacterium]|nr:MAG: hypothetical protein C4583_05780 [Anaerolineaceae bacterium]
MKHGITIFLLLIITSVAQAGELRALFGSEIVALNKGEDRDTYNGLFSLGIEYSPGNSFSYGFSAAFSDLEDDADGGIKGDGYLKYNFRPKHIFNPFLAVGISAAAFNYQECGMHYGNDGAGYYSHNGCESRSVGSIGAIYQVGATITFGGRIQLNGFWSQFAGTNNVILNIVSIRGSF